MAENQQNLDIKQAAGRLGVHRNTLDRMINSGEIAICRIRGRVFIPQAVVNDFICKKTITISKGKLCPSENGEMPGKSDFKLAAKDTKNVLHRLLHERTL